MAVVEQLVSAPEADLVYMARRQSLRLVRAAKYNQYGASGQKVGESVGETLTFKDGVLRVPKAGKVALEDGNKADAAEVAAWLDSHRLYGDIEEGFWRVDPTAPPVSDEELERLMDAAFRLDAEMLRRMAEQERAGWGREAIIRRAEESAQKIDDALAAEAERQAALAGDDGDTVGPKPAGKAKGGGS